MNPAPFELVGSLRVGAVDFVAPDEIKVALDIEAPESVALNAGGPRPFPRVNGYLLIPVDDAFLVGQVEWLTVEHSPFPKRRGMKDFGLIDLPYPLRRLRLNPLGTLRQRAAADEHVFRRGADALPSIGAVVLLPTEAQLRSIVESGDQRRVKIGTSSLAGDAKVSIDPDRLFGRHLAVLGNTGSGKSCSVAGLIRWSLEEAMRERTEGRPNARFIVLDPNGEYARAFGGDDGVKARVFKADPGEGEFQLKVPLWFWNNAEWCSFTRASRQTQIPLLRRALREVKAGVGRSDTKSEEQKLQLRRYLSSRLTTINGKIRSGEIQTRATNFGFLLRAIFKDLDHKRPEHPECNLEAVQMHIQAALESTHVSTPDRPPGRYYNAFEEAKVAPITGAMGSVLETLGGIIYQEGPDEDTPLMFNGADLADHLELLAEQENVSQFLDFLVARIRTLLSNQRLRTVIENSQDLTLESWLHSYVGNDEPEDTCVTIIDLSLVPTEVVHIVTAVIARMTFEALQRYMKQNHAPLPTVLVMEEAHTFIKRYKEDIENQDAATICCQMFERIAREGRKFGLGLVLSSQRPSELSPTVLSQCNTFLLHRISNDRDQELVNRLVPDNLRGLLRELPSLPSQSAVLLGWASELPVLVKMNDLPKSQQPHSDDPKFWDVWVGQDNDGKEVAREAKWQAIADEWQSGPPTNVEDQKESK